MGDCVLSEIKQLYGDTLCLKGNVGVTNPLLFGTPADYRWALELVKNQGVQLLRVWSGGMPEDDCFYGLCDELGLMVMQDSFPANNVTGRAGVDVTGRAFPPYCEKTLRKGEALRRVFWRARGVSENPYGRALSENDPKNSRNTLALFDKI